MQPRTHPHAPLRTLTRTASLNEALKPRRFAGRDAAGAAHIRHARLDGRPTRVALLVQTRTLTRTASLDETLKPRRFAGRDDQIHSKYTNTRRFAGRDAAGAADARRARLTT